MLEWIARGLAQGRITTRYPRLPEHAPDGFRGRVRVLDDRDAPTALTLLCPSGAIAVDAERRLTLDRGRCVLCGECVRRSPDRFAFDARYETAATTPDGLIVGAREVQAPPEPVRRALGERARALRRSIHVRHVDCGSDGSEEWEIQALWNPYYDIQRLGFFLTAAPRHADVLLATGPVTSAMREPLERTWQVMPEPKALIAVGSDACGGGLCSADRAAHDPRPTAGGLDAVLPVDVYVPGSPPAPIAIMHALLIAVGLLAPEAAGLLAPEGTDTRGSPEASVG
ncbi:MAG: NADH-quinone oxidoreductase subunit B family protein [Solirubrobacteraceae bacterium]